MNEIKSKVKKHFVYMVRCNDNSLYTGWTVDLEKRLRTHNFGEGPQAAKYTKAKRPVVLVYYEELSNKSEALKREAQIKKMTKLKKEQMVKDAQACLSEISSINETCLQKCGKEQAANKNAAR